MYQQINEYDFIRAFEQVRPDNFSRAGLSALYEYFEQLEEDIGNPIKLDVIGICCEYAEYESLEEFQEDYGDDYESIEDIESETTVISVDDDGFIILQF
jgi:hypothetical protein